MRFAYFGERDYGDEINFPNGITVKLCYGISACPKFYGDYDRLLGDSRKTIIYDSKGDIITECIEDNPNMMADLDYPI